MNKLFSARSGMVFAFILLLTATLPAQATILCANIDQVVFDKPQSVDTSGLNLSIEVIDEGDAVQFIFLNDSSIDSSITDIYFESTDYSLRHLKNGRIVTSESAGVDFGNSTSPSKPTGSIKNFGGKWSGNLLNIGAVAPSSHNGINPGEYLAIRFDYSEIDFDDLMLALSDPLQFRIVEHVQGLPSGNSVWTMNASHQVPLPSTLLLMSAGLIGMARSKRPGRS